jgi:nucleoside-diphosphate-sugar epimerase
MRGEGRFLYMDTDMDTEKRALVRGAGGFIGGHLVKRLKDEGYFVRGVDIKQPEYRPSFADEFLQGDLREQGFCRKITSDIQFDELYQLAADMGGAGYIFTGEHDAQVMHNSAAINLNIVEEARKSGSGIMVWRYISPISITYLVHSAPGMGGGRRPPPPYAGRSRKRQAAVKLKSGGDGEHTRTFLYVDECLEGIRLYPLLPAE